MSTPQGGEPTRIARRTLLQGAAASALLWCGRGAIAASQRTVDVRKFGARGDGRADDTDAFEAALDALPGGGILDVPAGDYMIDTLRSIRLHDGVHLRMARDARLLAQPNAAPRSYVILLRGVNNIRISGGAIVGDRDRHMGLEGEWGHGIAIYSVRNLVISDIHISKCWGDGMSIGGKAAQNGNPATPSMDIEIANVTSTGNRRQGLSIGRSRRVYVHDSEFSGTGGTPPQAGIDVEPDKGDIVQDVRIERCVVRGNRGPGIQVWKDTHEVSISDCTIEDNRNAGILAVGATDLKIRDNRIRDNTQVGIALRKGTQQVAISKNVFERNAPGRPRASRDGRDPRWARHLEVTPDSGAVEIAPDNRLD